MCHLDSLNILDGCLPVPTQRWLCIELFAMLARIASLGTWANN